MERPHKQGFTLIEAVLAFAVIGLIAIAGWYAYRLNAKGSVVSGGSFSTSKTSILYNNSPYVPYGVTIYGLADTKWQVNLASDIAQIKAIAGYWHGNTVRIQVAPDLYNSPPSGYLAAFNQEVSTARKAGLNVIISAQYERTKKIAGPNDTTVSFWKSVALSYAHDPHVWFDLFNEPRYICSGNAVPASDCWQIWRNGGSGYVGMQTLADTVRASAPNNLILAEGLAGGKTLSGINGYLLSGSNIVYSVHPYFGSMNDTPSLWDSNFGTISSQIPVLVGEWGEYQTNRNSCVADAPTLVPTFLSYLVAHHIGLIAWTLQPGNMIRGTNLEDPTAFDPGVAYQCVAKSGLDAQGAGADIRALFVAH